MKFPSLLEIADEQQAVIDLPFHGAHVVTGASGVGKTVMAVYRAWALATARRRVTLFTRSNLLRQYISQASPELTEFVEVTTFDRWIRQLWQSRFHAQPPCTDEDGWNYSWFEMHRDCILQRITSSTHLVVDEAQDVPVHFYELCRTLGVGVTAFANEEQRIDDDHSTVAEICRALAVQSDPIVLHENHRNTREIALLAAEFHGSVNRNPVHLPTQTGYRPGITRVPSLDHFLTEFAHYFQAHKDHSIGIICRSTLLQREIQSRLTHLKLDQYTQAYVSNDRYRADVNFPRFPILIVNTASVKGLEFDSVFVPDLDTYTEDPTTVLARLRLFLLCTRARKDLHFAYRGVREPPILSGVSESLLTRRDG